MNLDARCVVGATFGRRFMAGGFVFASAAGLFLTGCTWHGPCVHYHAAEKTWTISPGTIEPPGRVPDVGTNGDMQTPNEIIEDLLGNVP